MAYTWAQFKALVATFLTERAPSDDAFVEAAAEYVKARVAGQIGDDKFYAIHENKYRSLRRRLAGHQTELTDAVLRSRVRALISDTTATDGLFAQAVAYYVKAEIAREVDADPALSDSFRKSYAILRPRLLGFECTLDEEELRAEVDKLLPVDKDRDGISEDYIDALISHARDDIEGMKAWIDAQIDQAKAELQALNDRMQKELRQGVIDLQHFIEAYRVGHTTDLTEDDVERSGFASLGALPEQAQLREAWIIYDTYLNPEVHRDKAAPVKWEDRQEMMLGIEVGAAQIAIDPYGRNFLCTPRLDLATGVSLKLVWDGLKLDFADGDETPFDEGAAKAVGAFVQAELAAEFGDPMGVVRQFKSDYALLRSRLYIETRERQSIRRADWLRQEPGYPVRSDDRAP